MLMVTTSLTCQHGQQKNGVKKIELIQTNDGKTFRDIKDAEHYIADKVREAIDKWLTGITDNGKLKRDHVIDIILYLIPDYENAKSLIKDLNDVFEELEEE